MFLPFRSVRKLLEGKSFYPDIWGKGRFHFGGLTDATEGRSTQSAPFAVAPLELVHGT